MSENILDRCAGTQNVPSIHKADFTATEYLNTQFWLQGL